MGGGGGGVGGGEDSFSLVFENSIVLIKCTLYDTVFQRQVSICRGVVFSYSFSIYCAAYHGIWCSVNGNISSPVHYDALIIHVMIELPPRSTNENMA